MSIKREIEKISEINKQLKSDYKSLLEINKHLKESCSLFVIGTAGLSRVINEHIERLNQSFEVISIGASEIFELDIHNWSDLNKFKPPCLELKPPVKHGAYRQFIKRDKRKNFKLNK
jgi:hypothetical protein